MFKKHITSQRKSSLNYKVCKEMDATL